MTAHSEKEFSRIQEQAEGLAAMLPPLLVDAEHLAASVNLGVHGRRRAGMGESFWQFRRYAVEDPASAVDWRQSAKSQHLFVREREWEAAQTVWFWRDAGATMRFRSEFAEVTKVDRASVVILALASLLVRGGERIALLGSRSNPASGRVALHRIAHELATAQTTTESLPPDAAITRNSQLVWASDFLSPIDDIRRCITQFAASGVSGHLLHIIDPAEEDFPFEGRTRFDAVSGRDSELFGRSESVKSAYARRFHAHMEEVALLARQSGWSYLSHRTDRNAALALVGLHSVLGGETAQRIA